MQSPSRISRATRMSVPLMVGAIPPVATGLATGGLTLALGAAFLAGGPLLAASSARWPIHAPRLFPLYLGALFVAAIAAFEFNSLPFVVDTWSALLLGLLTLPAGHPTEIDSRAVARPPASNRRSIPRVWPAPTLVGGIDASSPAFPSSVEEHGIREPRISTPSVCRCWQAWPRLELSADRLGTHLTLLRVKGSGTDVRGVLAGGRRSAFRVIVWHTSSNWRRQGWSHDYDSFFRRPWRFVHALGRLFEQ